MLTTQSNQEIYDSFLKYATLSHKEKSTVFMPLEQKLKEAYSYASTHHELDNSLWQFQPFSMSMGELLMIALNMNVVKSSDLIKRVESIYNHILMNNQFNEAVWSVHSFSFSVGELVEKVLSVISPSSLKAIRDDVNNHKISYFKAQNCFVV